MSRYNQPATGYRGMPSTGPVAPYAFTSTPQPATSGAPRHQSYAHAVRSPQSQPLAPTQPKVSYQSQPQPLSLPTLNNSLSLDFSKLPALDLTLPASTSISSMSPSVAAKPSPDRYRRNVRRENSSGESGPNRVQQGSALPSGSGMAAVGQLYNHPTQSSSSPSLSQYQSYRGSTYVPPSQPTKSSADDMLIGRSQNTDLAARYRRRSFGSIETPGLVHTNDPSDAASPHPNAFIQNQAPQLPPVQTPRSTSGHAHTGSRESVASSRSDKSSRPTSARNETKSSHIATQVQQPPQHIAKQDTKLLNTPRPDSARRTPSPLSRPVQADVPQEPMQKRPAAATPVHNLPSPAMEQLEAVTQKEAKKPKSKLRRAFSFGSAAELRKATAQANLQKSTATATPRHMKRGSKYEDELEPEQARIAERQEAAGLGESIYSGQGHFFTGSTDNLSVSSTASSASLMLRKMGKGMKKSTRSLVGLFRPKSVVGVPAADGPVNAASAAQVSMVTVEAEREKVNVNLDPHEHAGGGTGFPKLERNSIDTKLSVDRGTVSSESMSRRSIVGGERERAEVLAAVKKGILKRGDSNQSSPRLTSRPSERNLPQIPAINDSPRSSAPSTPNDEPPRSGHRRTDSIAIEGDDYFASVTRFASIDSKTAAPLTPQAVMRNISFSPRIQFHDTWTGTEYDRRGEIATCNRLTPMLAQQIKEELNTFKMVSLALLTTCEDANNYSGDGSPRILQGLYPLLLSQPRILNTPNQYRS